MKTADPHKDKAKKIIIDIFKILAPIAISAILIIWLMRKVDVHKMDYILRHDCDFFWVALMMVMAVLSYVIRGIRWGIQLRGAGLKRVSVMDESVSIFGAYALNLLVPLLGEGWRCVYMAKREKAPVATVVGTDLGDRFSDAVAIVVLFILSIFVARDKIMKFIDHYSLGERILHLVSNPWLWVSVVLLVVIFILFLYIFRDKPLALKINATIQRLWHGFKILFTMDGLGEYLLLTLGIWVCYYLETYFCFYAFPFTRELITQPGSFYGLIPGLVAFVFGSMSIAIPSNGGLGPWNVAVMYSLSLYGVTYTQAVAYSMVLWGFKSATIVALGIFSAIYIMRQSRKEKPAVAVRPASPGPQADSASKPADSPSEPQ